MGGTRVELTVSNGTARITLDGPETRNALDAAAAAELGAVCEEIDKDATIGAAIITGAGPAFCSGADTRVLDALRGARPDEIYEGLDDLYTTFRRFGQLSVPTLAAINGAAVGAGLNLALAADLRIVASDAVLVSGFARIGLHPGGGHLHLLARTGGIGTAAAAGVFAQAITADRAVATGLAWTSVPAVELLPVAERSVAHLAADPVLARALAATLRRTTADPAAWDRAVEIERARQMWSLSRPGKEG
jgi:enoyl-CoA hydratase